MTCFRFSEESRFILTIMPERSGIVKGLPSLPPDLKALRCHPCGWRTAVARTGDVLRRPKIRRTLDAIAGTVLVGFGVRLATEQR